MRILLSIVLVFLNVSSFCQVKETFQTKQIAESKKMVNFIFIKNKEGKIIPYGTGFFVAKKVDSLWNKIYLATSKHVLKDSAGNYLKTILLRYNLKNGKSELTQIPLIVEGNAANVFFHTDPSVDLALIPLAGDFDKIDFAYLLVGNMLNSSDFLKNGIAEGTEVFFTGLFTRYLGESKNYPISRFGKIALMPEEKIDFVDAKRDLILLETTSYGGNSGSPVFVSYVSGQYTIRKLIGVMTGSFEEFNEIGLLTNSIPISKENSGISAITPCNYLIEMINGQIAK